MTEYLDRFEKIQSNWEKPSSLFTLIILIVVLYFIIGEYFIKEFNRVSLINVLILLVVIILTVIYWYISTNRFPINYNSKTNVAILVNTDDNKVNDKIKQIIKDCFNDIVDTSKDINVFLLPINYLKTSKEIKQFLNTRGFSIETLLRVNLNSGNFLSDSISYEKMSIDKVECFANVRIDKSKQIYRTNVNLISDIKLSNFHKNWEYLEANSKADKLKYKVNLSDLILQYVAIYFIYLNKFECSLDILMKIHKNPNDLKVNKNKNNLKVGRFNAIILELLFSVSMKYYFNKENYAQCHKLLMSSFEVAGKNHSLALDCNSNLAITSYKLGDLISAKEFVSKVKLLKPSSSIVLFDEAFFSIIENKPEILAKKYKQLRLRFSSFKETNILDVIEFLSIEKMKFQDEINYNLFEFAEGYLSIMYSDKKLGIEILESFIRYYPNAVNYNENLYELAISSLRGSNKKNKYSTYKKVS